jgi:DNA-binding LacI/PurR family transcriptional regulator
MDDVARRAGVSRALVSLALRGSDRVSDTSRRAVQRAADDLGYRPNLVARHLASKRSGTIGLIVNDLHNPYFPGIADGIKRALDARGYRLLINSAFLDDGDELAALDTFIDFRVDGIILAGSRADFGRIERAGRSVPVVVASRPAPGTMAGTTVDTVNSNDRSGATLAVEHLIGLGHRHICHIDGGNGAGAALRRQGYEDTMRRHGLTPHVETAAFTEASGVVAAERALDGRRACTAIFAGNDLSALGAIDVVDRLGLRIPHDVSVIGYDNTFIASLRHLALTSIDQNRERLGEMAVTALLERVEEGRVEATHQVIEPHLVVRRTTAAVDTFHGDTFDGDTFQGDTVSAAAGSGGSPAPCTD